MATVTFRAREIGGERVNKDLIRIGTLFGDLTEFWPEVARLFRGSVEGEFAGKHWKPPGGGRVGWAPRKDDLPHPLLVKSGDLFSAWMNGPTTETRKTMTLRVPVPYASYHRDGNPPTLDQRGHGTDNPEFRANLNAAAKAFVIRRG